MCNGLVNLSKKCARCGAVLEECGRVADYMGPYSAYEEGEGSVDEVDSCAHLFACRECGWDQRVVFRPATINTQPEG